MKETNLAQIIESDRETDSAPQALDVRLLSDLELALAGGGDTVVTWP